MEWQSFSAVIYDALRDPSRRRILQELFEQPLTAGELTNKLGISRAAIDKHLNKLLDIGLIEKYHYETPRSHYKYEIPDEAQSLIEDLEDVVAVFVESQLLTIERKIEYLEQGFLLGYINKKQYSTELAALEAKKRQLLGE